MSTKPIVVVKGGYNGGKTVAEDLGNTEHRQKVLAEMSEMDGNWANEVADANGVPRPNTTNLNTNVGVNTNSADINNDIDKTINEVDNLYKKQIDNVNNSGAAMMQLQQDRTDFEIEKIEQQKDQAKKDFEKEQTSAYTDYQKQINSYGANAEQMASQGMSGTGYAESSKVRMYSDYQNRVAIARQSYQQAVVTYNNAMTEARLQNSTVLAQLAFDTLQKSLELSIQGLQYKNELLIQRENTLYQRQWNEEERLYQRERDSISDDLQKASLGDYSGLKARGWNINEDVLNYELNSSMREDALDRAITAAQYGNFQPLIDLGITPSQEYIDAFNKSLKGSDDDTGESPFSDPEPEITNPIDLNTIVSTKYYKGTVNPDAQYGVFKTTDNNGFAYQPDNIGGVKLEPTGDTYTFTTIIQRGENYGEETEVTQKVWRKKGDSKKWIWNGIENSYVPFPPVGQVYYTDMTSNETTNSKMRSV